MEIGDSILGNVERLFGVGEEVFDLPREEKEGFDWSGRGSYFGLVGLVVCFRFRLVGGVGVGGVRIGVVDEGEREDGGRGREVANVW